MCYRKWKVLKSQLGLKGCVDWNTRLLLIGARLCVMVMHMPVVGTSGFLPYWALSCPVTDSANMVLTVPISHFLSLPTPLGCFSQTTTLSGCLPFLHPVWNIPLLQRAPAGPEWVMKEHLSKHTVSTLRAQQSKTGVSKWASGWASVVLGPKPQRWVWQVIEDWFGFWPQFCQFLGR